MPFAAGSCRSRLLCRATKQSNEGEWQADGQRQGEQRQSEPASSNPPQSIWNDRALVYQVGTLVGPGVA
jgi:hypothetical protein